MVNPPENQYVASNSMETLSYNCTVGMGYTAIWEVAGRQYSRQSQLITAGSGIGLTIVSVDSNNRVSMISISNVTHGNLSLLCVAVPLFDLGAVKGEEYHVVSFGKSKVHMHVCGIFMWYCFIPCGSGLPVCSPHLLNFVHAAI